jgi:hypothetical protein
VPGSDLDGVFSLRTIVDSAAIRDAASAGERAVVVGGGFIDPLYRRQRRVEHWSNANYQCSEVGRILAGADGGYDSVSSFLSEVFGTTIKVFGDVSRFDTLTTEARSPTASSPATKMKVDSSARSPSARARSSKRS